MTFNMSIMPSNYHEEYWINAKNLFIGYKILQFKEKQTASPR